MNKLSSILNAFPKTIAAPTKEPIYQAKKYDAPPAKKNDALEPKNEPVEKTDPLDDKDQDKVERKFSDLVSEQEVNEAKPAVEVKAEAPSTVKTEADAAPIEVASTDTAPVDVAPSETKILASELADIKLNELNLNQTDNAPAETPITGQGVVEAVDTPEQVATTAPVPVTPENISNDNVEIAVVQGAAAKSMVKQPLTDEQNPQNLAENLEELSTDDLKKLGLSPEQANKAQSQTKNLLAEANGNDVNPKAEKALSELGATLGQTQNQLDKNSSELAGAKQTKMAQATTDQDAVKTELTGDKAVDAAQQNVTQQATPQKDKYAERYSQDQNGEQSLSADADKTNSAAHKQLTAAYTSVKSSTTDAQNANGSMSSLDKIADKNPSDFLNQLQNNIADQQVELNKPDSAANIKLSMQNGRLAQNLPLNSMAFQIGKQFSKGNSEFQIRLDPAELGRINIKLTVKQGGDVKAHMVTERNDVFELLQRDSRALEKALSEAGFDGKNIDIEVTLDQNAQNGGTFAERFFDQASDNETGSAAKGGSAIEAEEEVIEMVASHMPLHVTSTAVDRII